MAKSKATIWFCSIYIMCGMALTAMCFAVICDEFEHREKRPEEETKKRNKGNSPDEPSDTDPYHFDGWQFKSQTTSPCFYSRNLTEETLFSTSTQTSLADIGYEMVQVNTQIPEVLERPVMTGVYTLPEEPEMDDNGELTTEV